MAIVVSDTSPIRALHHLGILRVLESLYGRVYVPDAVAEELRRPSRRFPAFEPNAFPFLFIEAPRDQSKVSELEARLDRGEAAALVLAMEHGADLVLMDERAGREIARELGLTVIGVVGILIEAKDHGLIPTVRPMLAQLQDELNFYLAPALIADILRRAGEAASL